MLLQFVTSVSPGPYGYAQTILTLWIRVHPSLGAAPCPPAQEPPTPLRWKASVEGQGGRGRGGRSLGSSGLQASLAWPPKGRAGACWREQG